MRNIVGGWTITYDAGAPLTSRYKATRNGVSINAGDYFALVRMIRQRDGQ